MSSTSAQSTKDPQHRRAGRRGLMVSVEVSLLSGRSCHVASKSSLTAAEVICQAQQRLEAGIWLEEASGNQMCCRVF